MKLTIKFLRNFAPLGLLTIFALTFVAGYAFADDSVIAPTDFLAQVLAAIHNFGGLSWVLKVSAVITLIISSMKVSVLKDLVWSKLGSFQAWLAPVLGLLGGLIAMAASGGSVSLAGVLAYLSAGSGALILHELLDTIKAIPGIGPLWVGIIDTIEKLLGGK